MPTSYKSSQQHSEFSFEDMRRIEIIEEHANEALLVMTLNDKVLSALAQHYSSVFESTDFPGDLKRDCAMDCKRFTDRISDIGAEIATQKIRVNALLGLLADRKALVIFIDFQMRYSKLTGSQLHGILEYRNVEASKELTSKAQYSADHVEYMTQQMKQEAVFMRIITLVTLFFLPGTFVSVSFQAHLTMRMTDDSS